MNKKHYYIISQWAAAGFLFGLALLALATARAYSHGFDGPWHRIMESGPNFLLFPFAPFFFSGLLAFIGYKRQQLLHLTQQITQRLTVEESTHSATDQQIKLLGKVVAQINEGIIISDHRGKVQWVNEGFTKTTGFTLEDVSGKEQWAILLGPMSDHSAARSMTEKAIQGQDVVDELLSYHKDGSTCWLSVSIKPIFGDAGEITHLIAVQNNIAGRKEKEIAIECLYKEVANYKLALDQSSIVITFNMEGKIIHVNNKFCEINGLAEEDLIGQDYRSISISMRDKQIMKPIWELLSAGKTWKGELVNRNKNGRTYWAETIIVPLFNANGQPHEFLAIQQDITERKKLQDELLYNKSKLQQAMRIARLGSWEVDADHHGYISKELKALYQINTDMPVTVRDVVQYIHPEDQEAVVASLARARTTLQQTEVEYRFLAEGKTHYMISYNYPQVNEAGEYIGAFGSVQDITATKYSALALKKSEEEKAVVLNNTQTIICLHDMEGVILDLNPSAEKMSGFNKEEALGLNLRQIVPGEHQAEFDKYLITINNNDTASGTFQIYTKWGCKRVWLYQNAVYQNTGGKPYVIASAIDITESVKAQNELEKQKQFVRQIIDNSPNVIFMLNEQRRVVLANQTFINYYPCNEKDMPLAQSLSTGPDDIFLGDVESIFEMEDGEVLRLEGSLDHPLRDTISWFNIIFKCFKEKNGKKYILGFGMDITGRHQVETDLMAANEMVERSLKVKDQFISNMSHEIRTPLNAVIGFTDLLADTALNFEQAEYVDIVKTASANLLALINNILDLSKIESSKLDLENLPIDIRKIVRDVVKIMEPKAKMKGIGVNAFFDPILPCKVMGDQLRLTQVMFNLLGNAVKFTDNGHIDISCKMVDGSDRTKNYIAFSIKDTGIGVPVEKQTQIFERFTQANTDTQRLYGGTGLGLNITKSIVDLYGGTLSMESEPGKGTTFYFILPFKKYVETENLAEVKSEDGDQILSINTENPIHILLAEDNMINAMLATQVLTKKGFTLLHVQNGEAAVAAVQEHHFDVVLMDIQMPVMNGINATLAIRQLPTAVANIPIIAMTAHSLNGEMQNCYNAGMNGYVSKPFKAADLYNSIIEAIKKPAPNAVAVPGANKYKLIA